MVSTNAQLKTNPDNLPSSFIIPGHLSTRFTGYKSSINQTFSINYCNPSNIGSLSTTVTCQISTLSTTVTSQLSTSFLTENCQISTLSIIVTSQLLPCSLNYTITCQILALSLKLTVTCQILTLPSTSVNCQISATQLSVQSTKNKLMKHLDTKAQV